MTDVARSWDCGDLDAEREAYVQHMREQHMRERAMADELLTHPADRCPDCGPFTGAWYPGDLDAACRAHAEHAEFDWRMLA